MTAARWAAVAVLALACAEPPPAYLQLDEALSVAQRAAAEDAIRQWCEAVCWCPEVVRLAPNKVIVLSSRDFAKRGNPPAAFGANARDGNIYLDGGHSFFIDESWAWTMFAHEFGHYGIEGHSGPAGSLMSRGPLQTFELDVPAREAWLSNWGGCIESP